MLYNDILENECSDDGLKKKNWKKISGIVMFVELLALGQESTTTIFIYSQQYG